MWRQVKWRRYYTEEHLEVFIVLLQIRDGVEKADPRSNQLLLERLTYVVYLPTEPHPIARGSSVAEDSVDLGGRTLPSRAEQGHSGWTVFFLWMVQ